MEQYGVMEQLYKLITGEPPIFWVFEESILHAGYRIEQQTAPTGDLCHYNIQGISDAALKALLRARVLSDFCICTNGHHRSLQQGDLI
jgi:hypothetical protein